MSFDSSHITPQKSSSASAASANHSQSQNSTPANQNGGGGSHQKSASMGSKGAHLTPLKPVADKNLETDDTLFTESFVRKLTPRSNEACRLLGVLPDELVLRSYENFYEHGISPNIQKLRYQDYEQMRQETIAMVREERQTLIQQGWTQQISPSQKLKIQSATLKAMMLPASDGSPARSRSNTSSPARSVSAGNDRTMQKSATTGDLHSNGVESLAPPAHPHQGRSALLPHLMPEELLLEMEQDRLRKTMVRQNKEIESMMAYELKVAQMLAKQEQKLEMRKIKEQQLAEARREERFRQAEKRRLWEMQKIEEENKLKEANQLSMARLNAQERKHMEEMQAKDEERKRLALIKTQERRQKKMEAELRAQQNINYQFQLARERERDMQERDRRRKETLEEKKQRLAEEHARLKQEAQERVQNVLFANRSVMEEKRNELNRKMQEMETRLKQFEELKQQIAHEKSEEIRLKEERRLAALHDSRAQLDGRISGILDKKAKHDALKEELEQKAREQHTLKMELRRLNKIRKQANVERLKRMQEYHRISLNEKLSDEAKRLKELEEQKKSLLAKRQQNAINMFRQKEALMKMFSDMSTKRNWEALSKLTIQDGKISTDSSAEASKSATLTSPIKFAQHQQQAAAQRRHDQEEDEDTHFGAKKKKEPAGEKPVNLLDALQGLNKLVNKQKKKEIDTKFGSPKKNTNIDDYLRNQNRANSQMQKSKSTSNL